MRPFGFNARQPQSGTSHLQLVERLKYLRPRVPLSGIPASNRVSSLSPEFLATGGETWIQGHASIHKNARSVDVVRLIGG